MAADEFNHPCASCAQASTPYLLGVIGDVLRYLCADCLVARVWERESERLGIPVEDMARRVAAAQDRRDFIKLMHRARPANEDES